MSAARRAASLISAHAAGAAHGRAHSGVSRELPSGFMSLEAARECVGEGLHAVAGELAADGMPRLEVRGKLVRPVVALAAAGPDLQRGFWMAAAAIQLAHEASLLHDDIVDGAAERRGMPSMQAAHGVARALVLGDHLLTSAYCAAARTGSYAFIAAFARAVERTVAGERRQAEVAGRRLDALEQRAILSAKSGELFACALAAPALLANATTATRDESLGRRIGVLYQRIDDLLDYLPEAETGKPALADYRHRYWTWPLDLLDGVDFGDAPEHVGAGLCTRDAGGEAPLERAFAEIDVEIDTLGDDLRDRFGENGVLTDLLEGWRSTVIRATATSPEPSRTGPWR